MSLAELEMIYGSNQVEPINNSCARINANEVDIKRLGGTIKVAKIIAEGNRSSGLEKALAYDIGTWAQDNGKTNLGISLYGVDDVDPNQLGLKIKRALKPRGIKIRTIPNKSGQLNSAQVLHNKLYKSRHAEYVICKSGDKLIIGRTKAVQNITDYTKRDRQRPKRDARVGMLPPKLAQIMLNLALGNQNKPIKTILDPFCGTGVLLQEALLLGLDVYGSDNSQRMIDYSRQNLEWLCKQYDISGKYKLAVGDATSLKWPQPIGVVVSETYLGPPMAKPPHADRLSQLQADARALLVKFLSNLGPQLEPATRLCLAIPAWRVDQKTYRISVVDRIAKLGYNRLVLKHVATKDLIYFRTNQVVARELLILEKI